MQDNLVQKYLILHDPEMWERIESSLIRAMSIRNQEVNWPWREGDDEGGTAEAALPVREEGQE